MLTCMADDAQFSFRGPKELREAFNERARSLGVPAKVLYLLGAHLLLRRTDAEAIAQKFNGEDNKGPAFLEGFKPGEPHPLFPDAPASVADALGGVVGARRRVDAPRHGVPKDRRAGGV